MKILVTGGLGSPKSNFIISGFWRFNENLD